MNTIYRNRSVSTDGRFRARTVNQSKLSIKALYNFNQSGTTSNFFSVQPIRNILNIIVLFSLLKTSFVSHRAIQMISIK